MSELDDLDDFYKDIENVNDPTISITPTTTTTNNIQTNSTIASNNNTTTTANVDDSNKLKRKLDEITTPTITSTKTTTVNVGVKPMVPPSLMKKKQMVSKAINNNNSNGTSSKAVVSSKAVTYSATTINAMAQDLLKPKLTNPINNSLYSSPSYPSATAATIAALRPMVTMEEPKKVSNITMEAAGEKWVDPTLSDWDPNDFRIFVGDLGNDVSEEMVRQAFCKYPTFLKAKVVFDKVGKSRGFGFVSFSSSSDFLSAMKEMNGKYIGNRPIKLKKSKWKSRCAQD